MKTFIFIVSRSLRITEFSVNHNKVMNIYDFFGLYVEVFKTWTSHQQNEVLNIVQAKRYPEVPTF